MAKYKYIHLINKEIKNHISQHPFNNSQLNNLNDKTTFMNCFINDISNGTTNGLNKDDDYKFNDISNGKQNLFNFKMPNGQDYNIFIEHPDGGGRDISFNQTSKKVLIPYSNISFKETIKEMKNILVMNIYYNLIEENGVLTVDKKNYCYLVIVPSEIYTSEVVYNILYDIKKSNGSSRWVKLEDIQKCMNTKQNLINEKGNVWIIHPENISDFLESVVIDDYHQQFRKAYIKLLEIAYSNKQFSSRQKEILKARSNLRKKLLSHIKKCQISICNIKQKECLVASHIWPVNKILSETNIKWDKKLEYISDTNNAFLFCNLHDKLFDRFLISFEDDGKLKVSKILKRSISAYNLEDNIKYLEINNENKFYLQKHRNLFENIEKGRLI